MKKLTALLLVALMLLPLIACSGAKEAEAPVTEAPTEAAEAPAKTTEAPTPVPTEEPTPEPTEEPMKAEEINIGDTISLPFVEMTIDAFEVTDGYQFESKSTSSGISVTRKSSIDCPSGMKLVCVKGSFTNKSHNEIYPANRPADGRIILNENEYRITFRCYNVADAESFMAVAAQQTVDYFFYAEVPDVVANAIETCEVYIGFVENLDPSVWVNSLEDLQYRYHLEAIPTK